MFVIWHICHIQRRTILHCLSGVPKRAFRTKRGPFRCPPPRRRCGFDPKPTLKQLTVSEPPRCWLFFVVPVARLFVYIHPEMVEMSASHITVHGVPKPGQRIPKVRFLDGFAFVGPRMGSSLFYAAVLQNRLKYVPQGTVMLMLSENLIMTRIGGPQKSHNSTLPAKFAQCLRTTVVQRCGDRPIPNRQAGRTAV